MKRTVAIIKYFIAFLSILKRERFCMNECSMTVSERYKTVFNIRNVDENGQERQTTGNVHSDDYQ